MVLPLLFLVITIFFSNKISDRLGHKTTILIGLIGFAIFGVIPFFKLPFSLFLISRCLTGVFSGLFYPSASSLIQSLFSGNIRVKLTGYGTAVMTFGGVIISLLTGALLLIEWNYVFLEYLAALIVFFLIYKNVSYIPIYESNIKIRSFFTRKLGVCYATAFLHMVGFYIVIVNISQFVMVTNVFNPKFTALTLTTLNIASIIAGFIFSKIYIKKRIFFKYFPYLIYIFGMLMIATSTNFLMVSIGTALLGLYVGLMNSYLAVTLPSTLKEPQYIADAFRYSVLFIFVGQFTSPVIIGIINKVTRFSQANGIFLSAAIFGIILFIFNIFSYSYLNKNNSLENK